MMAAPIRDEIPADELALDVRRTIAIWIEEGLTFREMCEAVQVLPLTVGDQVRYLEWAMYGIAAGLGEQ